MIPVKLELYNFLAYRTPDPLDFTGLHMACLARPNCSGKLLLLEAMTWSLSGKARSHTDNELIHGEEAEMQVRLTFALEGSLYRATRYRSRKGQGSSLLTLEIQAGDGWRNISESTIRATQERLDALLRLDYQTFINSAFLVQGRADEFTRKTPAERKAILSEILGLDIWGEYEERAKRILRDLEQEQGGIDAQIAEIDAELGRELEYQRELNTAHEALDVLRQQVREAEIRFHELEDARRERDAASIRYADFQKRIEEANAALARIQSEQAGRSARLAEFSEVLAARADIESGYSAWQAARQQERGLSALLQQQSGLLKQQSELKESVQTARAELLARQSALRQKRSDRERDIHDAGDGAGLAQMQADLQSLEAREAEIGQWQAQVAALREEQGRLSGLQQHMKGEVDQKAEQINVLKSTTEPLCPLCGQPLSDTHREELLARLEQERKESEAQWREDQKSIEAVSREIARFTREIDAAERELRKLPPLRKHLGQLQERHDRAQSAHAELQAVQQELDQLEASLADGAFARQEQAALAEVQSQLAAPGYDETAHQEAQEAINTYAAFEQRKNLLEMALQTSPEIEAALARLAEQAADYEGHLAANQVTLEGLQAEIAALDESLVNFQQFAQNLADLKDQEASAVYNVGAAEQKLNALVVQRRRREELLDRRDHLSVEQSIYEDLRRAAGKDGVPAMLIEAAIPEIEEGANQILARMTDGRMNIRFDTQREKVTGGVKETLDIKIADELGTRDYATFSGGETFRVNFAIRLALSRLLAHRAGTQLRTLIIDEGFGTQDAQGRERLVTALNAIQDEFDLVLVITHIDELKEAFPARIEVTKTSAGSLIELA